MFKAYKYRIYPTSNQVELFANHFGCTRMVYNLALQIKIDAYRSQGKHLTAFDLQRQLPDLKKEFEFFKEVDSQALQASIKRIDVAFRRFYKGSGFPFRSRIKKDHA